MQPPRPITIAAAPLAAALLLAACGSSTGSRPSGGTATGREAASTQRAVAGAGTSTPGRASAQTSHRMVRATAEGAGAPRPGRLVRIDLRTAGHGSRHTPAAAAVPAAGRAGSSRRPHRGTYVGPPHNGASSCGYVAIGPGLEQAEAFVVRSTSCSIARQLAAAARGHQAKGRLYYNAAGFSCTGNLPSATALLHFHCANGGQTVSFQIA